MERKTAETYQSFYQDLNLVKKHFDQQRKAPPIHPSLPKFAGAAMWARQLSKRLEKPMGLLNQAKHFLPDTADAGEVEQVRSAGHPGLEGYTTSRAPFGRRVSLHQRILFRNYTRGGSPATTDAVEPAR